MKNTMTNKPDYGKTYALTGATGTPCIANGNTWAESEVKPVKTAGQVIKQISEVYMPIVRELHQAWLDQYQSMGKRKVNAAMLLGPRYAKITVGEDGRGRSVHTFIDLTNGDILKAATFRAPAKNGVRGNIFSDDGGRSVIDWHGAKYINGGLKGKMRELKQ